MIQRYDMTAGIPTPEGAVVLRSMTVRPAG